METDFYSEEPGFLTIIIYRDIIYRVKKLNDGTYKDVVHNFAEAKDKFMLYLADHNIYYKRELKKLNPRFVSIIMEKLSAPETKGDEKIESILSNLDRGLLFEDCYNY